MACIGAFLYVPSLYHSFFEDENTLNVVAFAQLISPEARRIFKERTGITIRLTHVESDDEIVAKLKLNQRNGYDMIIAFDYTIAALRQEDVLAQLDHNYLSNLTLLDNRFLNHSFDPDNLYSVPFSYLAYGIGYNTHSFNPPEEAISWKLIFNNPKEYGYDYKICMLNEMREVMFLAGLYRFGNNFSFTDVSLQEIKHMLMRQRGWVETYASDRLDYLLLAQSVPLVVTPSAYMKKVLVESQKYAFSIPPEGTLISIENCAIPKTCKKIDKVHTFINFLISEEVNALNCNEYGLYPVNINSYKYLNKELFVRLCFPLNDTLLKKSITIGSTVLPLQCLEDIWMAIKAS
jgi:spermidine/putrescine transport system substrate-binding protein